MKRIFVAPLDLKIRYLSALPHYLVEWHALTSVAFWGYSSLNVRESRCSLISMFVNLGVRESRCSWISMFGILTLRYHHFLNAVFQHFLTASDDSGLDHSVCETSSPTPPLLRRSLSLSPSLSLSQLFCVIVQHLTDDCVCALNPKWSQKSPVPPVFHCPLVARQFERLSCFVWLWGLFCIFSQNHSKCSQTQQLCNPLFIQHVSAW
jgi:hypothetical protein